MEQPTTYCPPQEPCPPDAPGGPLGLSSGRHFTITMRGYGDTPFLVVTIDLDLKRIKFESSAVLVHSNFTTTYAYVSFKNAEGVEVYSHDFIGNQRVSPSIYTFTLSESGGEQLYFYHAEHNSRCVVKNETTGAVLTASRFSQVVVKPDGIDISAASNRLGSVPTFAGNRFRIIVRNFDDYADVMYFNIDLVTAKITTEVFPVFPNVDEPPVAFSYLLMDKHGQYVNGASLLSNRTPVPYAHDWSLEEGWTLQLNVMAVRLFILNLETNVLSRIGTITLKSVPRGLLQV
ncbi:putative mucin/carbohydrate-binding domain-containing protein [Cupriavidus agavae]|uniref:Carbohydrate-binding protein (Putative mucin) n=1 Tax=Cupriavidus agavae TaxID=1001822 RepID=A0A4Q7S6F5_9BURK|nr:putative mucin/carbohydrate-binding domain-containing protein [Cupriavidus agavae]RZT41954.1 carbohydrate-binding protein (putative mucin) [Cupriavidus agavae]